MSLVRNHVLAAKERLAQGYQKICERHRAGVAGSEVSAALTQLRDQVLLTLFDTALADLAPQGADELREQMALVAHGGYGRRDVAPFSDVDLMVLHVPGAAQRVAPVAERLLRDVFDAGLVLGHSVCDPEQACQLAGEDVQAGTSLGEARLLAGNETLFDEFREPLIRRIRRRAQPLLTAIDRARTEERLRYGETVFLLEPNVKRSRGTLRDLQLLRWVGLARYGQADPVELARAGLLPEKDLDVILRAREFLLRLRNELHFHAGKAADVLDRGEQLRIAELYGYQPVKGMLPVEQFMRDYFRHTDQVSHVVGQFLNKARSRESLNWWLTTLFGHRVQDGLRVGPAGVVATRRGLEKLRGSFRAIIELVDLANLYDKPIAASTWDEVRRQAPQLPAVPDPDSCRHFVSLLSHPARLGQMLRDLHEIGILERFVPSLAHARGLLQFNQYHKYTVDEHCLRAVEAAVDLVHDEGSLGRAYRWIGRKRLLHLALLIHDLGKGFPEDHISVGTRLAEETAQRLNLAPLDAETLKFLVANHQMMGTLAFRRDTSDEQMVIRFAVEVGSPELLAMLFVLTAADYSAVGPGVWDGWKSEILTGLYNRAMEHLAGDVTPTSRDEQLQQRREAVLAWLGIYREDEWFLNHLQALPSAYLMSTPGRQIADDLRMLNGLDPDDVIAHGTFMPESGTVQFTVGTRENIVPGIFHRLTGALSSLGLVILSAQINTLPDGLVIDRFWVSDPDFTGPPPADRIEQVNHLLVQALRSPSSQTPTFRRRWRLGQHAESPLPAIPTRVQVDNSSSQRYTVFDIFAQDRVGLLYTITRRLFELDLSVERAKIATHLDQVLDVFYVTDRNGSKVTDEQRLWTIRQELAKVIDSLEKAP